MSISQTRSQGKLAKADSQGLWICCYLTTLSYQQETHLRDPKKLYQRYGGFYGSLKGFLQENYL